MAISTAKWMGIQSMADITSKEWNKRRNKRHRLQNGRASAGLWAFPGKCGHHHESRSPKKTASMCRKHVEPNISSSSKSNETHSAIIHILHGTPMSGVWGVWLVPIAAYNTFVPGEASPWFPASHAIFSQVLSLVLQDSVSTSDCLKYEGSKEGKKIDLIHTSVCTMSPPPIGISVRQGKTVRFLVSFWICFLEDNHIFNIYQ